MRRERIIFNLQAQNSEADGILVSIDDQIDADLKDQESSFILNLKEEQIRENK